MPIINWRKRIDDFEIIHISEIEKRYFTEWNLIGWICKYCGKRGVVEGCELCKLDSHELVRTFSCKECSDKKGFQLHKQAFETFGTDCRLCLKKDLKDWIMFNKPHPMSFPYAICIDCFNRFGFLQLQNLTKIRAKKLRRILREALGKGQIIRE